MRFYTAMVASLIATAGYAACNYLDRRERRIDRDVARCENAIKLYNLKLITLDKMKSVCIPGKLCIDNQEPTMKDE
jgi:hypothetical protein